MCGSPLAGVDDHPLDVLIIIDREGFVSGREIKDPPQSSLPATSAAKDIAASKPADEHQHIWLWNIKKLAVHFGMGEFKILSDPLGYRVPHCYRPDA